MKPTRHFRFANKKEAFAIVGFRYDQPSSIEYDQYKEPQSVARTVERLLTMENGADIISIRRIYLDKDSDEPMQDWKVRPKEQPVLDKLEQIQA